VRTEKLPTDKNTLKSVAIAYELTFYLFQKTVTEETLTQGVKLSEKPCEFAEPMEYPPGPPVVHGPHVGNLCSILDE